MLSTVGSFITTAGILVFFVVLYKGLSSNTIVHQKMRFRGLFLTEIDHSQIRVIKKTKEGAEVIIYDGGKLLSEEKEKNISKLFELSYPITFQTPATKIMLGILNFHYDLMFYITIIVVFIS
jgi:nitrogen regulatory protein PII-like uncharacterized protein